MMALRHAIPPDTLAAQTRAADPGVTAWVSANAGSGKTHVLTQRVIRLLLAGTPPSKILCLTFTKAAAANMSLRVFDTLSKWTTLDDDALESEIRKTGAPFAFTDLAFARRLFARTVETPGGLKIQTIHAFCERLLHLFPFEANVASHFRVIEDIERAELLKEARDKALALALEDEASPLGAALAKISGQTSAADFDELLEAVLAKRDKLMRGIEAVGGDLARYEGALRSALDIKTNRNAAELEADITEGGLPPANWLDYAARLDQGTANDKGAADRLRKAVGASGKARREAYEKVFLTDKNTPRATLTTAGLSKADPTLKDALVTEQLRICAARELLKSVECLERSAALLRISAQILRSYAAMKNARALLDFDDLIEITRNLLAGAAASWVLYKLDSGIDHILVDEAQDTSPGQWDILRALAEEFMAGEGQRSLTRTFFAVGDEKQSIYSFQGAQPDQFDKMRRKFETRAREAELDFASVPLQLSFRSAPGILACVDAVFADAGNRRGLVYGDDVNTSHSALKSDLPSVVEIWPLVGTRDTTEERDWQLPVDLQDKHDPPAILARRIGDLIAGWLRADSPERVCDENGLGRAIRAGDVMILVRRRNAFFDAVIRALKEKGVPVAGADRLQLLQNIAVMDLVAAGRAALLPQDDLALACVLKSPLLGLTDEDLLEIAPERKGGLYEALGASENPAHKTAFARIESWRLRARADGPFRFYAHLLGAEGGRRLIQQRLGPESRDAMDEFVKLALDHEQRETPSLQAFLHELQDISIKRDMEAAGQCVRVLTVHAAKGLEGKIVLLPDTCSTPGSRFDPKIFELGDEHAPLLAWSPRAEADSGPIAPQRTRARDDNAEEYRRLLYVALTRAEERLYIMGFHGSRGPDADCWYEMVKKCMQDRMQDIPAFWDKETETVLRFVEGGSLNEAPQIEASAPTPMPSPHWLNSPAPADPMPAQPLRPSSALAAADHFALSEAAQTLRAHAMQAGRMVHELLQHLADAAPDARETAAQTYVTRRGSRLPSEVQESIARQALAVLGDARLAALFGPGSRAEVSLAGSIEVNGRAREIVGQIDRLAETETQVLIADFKTGTPPSGAMPASYAAQLALYRAAIQQLYPDREVQAFLIWTEGPRIEALTQEVAQAAFATLR